MTERTANVKLAVNIGSDPITGSVALDDEPPTSFCGWIELVAVIEEARHGGEDTDSVIAPGIADGTRATSGTATVREDVPLGSADAVLPANPASGPASAPTEPALG